MNNFAKAIMMALVGMSVVGTDLAAMQLRDGTVYQPDIAPVAPARPKAKPKAKKASVKTSKKDVKRATTSNKGVDLQAQIEAKKAEVAKLQSDLAAKKAAKSKKTVVNPANTKTSRAWGILTAARSKAVALGSKAVSLVKATPSAIKAIPSAVWSRLNRYRAAWGTGALAFAGWTAIQAAPGAQVLLAVPTVACAYKAYKANGNAVQATPKATTSKKASKKNS